VPTPTPSVDSRGEESPFRVEQARFFPSASLRTGRRFAPQNDGWKGS